MFRALVFAATALAAEGLHFHIDELKPPQPTQAPRAHASKSVFILGCSVDRYAVEWFCGHYEKFMRVACTDQQRDLAMGFVFHPGVGYNGDLQPPFYNRTRYGNIKSSVIGEGDKSLFEQSMRMVGEQYPDMVIVDSSLWDLANWANIDRRGDPTPERLQQWCDRDLPNMLKQVKRTFNKSRVIFRTAPFTARFIPMGITGVSLFSNEGIKSMRHCVKKKTKGGMLFGKYPVIDYFSLLESFLPVDMHGQRIKNQSLWNQSLWQADGYHPSKEPARLYINDILRLMDLPPVEEKDWAQKALEPAKIPPVPAKQRRMQEPQTLLEAEGMMRRLFDP